MSDLLKMGTLIASLRIKKRIKQKVFAELLNTTASYLSLIENNNKSISNPMLHAILGHLDISLEDFLFLLIEDRSPGKYSQELFCQAKSMLKEMLDILVSLKDT